MKRPTSAAKQQRKDSPGLQRGAAPGGRGPTNPKAEQPASKEARSSKAKENKVDIKAADWYPPHKTRRVISLRVLFNQGKKADAPGDVEQKRFDGAGYDSNLVESLERDIVSRNPNIHW